MVRLNDVAQSRDNNFNLIRAVAAVAVLVSHAYPIASGPDTPQPFYALTGFSLGSISVYAFFVISGFLIAQSYERGRSRTQFLVARFLRLWPGLIVSILAVALLLGPLVTALSPAAYFGDTETWTFIARNITLISVQYHLPGVFEDLPYTDIEGSIWTLLYEVLCYGGVFVLGVLGLLGRPWAMVAVFVAYVSLYFGVRLVDLGLHSKINALITLAFPFGVGTAFYIWRRYLPLTIWGVAVLALLAWVAKGTLVYGPLFTLALGYAVFWAAYIPKGTLLRSYNKLGDYSYGIYIYAFPLQGFAVWLWGPMTPLQNIILSLPLVLVPSILSWHLVEKPALDLRKQVTGWMRPKQTA
ncbi:MAG: acyltransferase [Pseudomonadota bacterium]